MKKSASTFFLICTVAITGLCIAPEIIHAQDSQGFSAGLNEVKKLAGEQKLSSAKSTKEILQSIVAWLTSLLGTVALISLVYGGYLYISSQGDEGNVAKGKAIILYSVIGIILVGLAGVIVNVVISVATQ